MPEDGKILYKCREVDLALQDDEYFVRIEGEAARGCFRNPIMAWSCFIDVLDGRVRRRIGDMLEQEGKNRFTGEPLEKGGKEDD